MYGVVEEVVVNGAKYGLATKEIAFMRDSVGGKSHYISILLTLYKVSL
jgi:acetyl esterase/lipase